MQKCVVIDLLDEEKLDGCLGSGTVAVIAIPLAFRRAASRLRRLPKRTWHGRTGRFLRSAAMPIFFSR
jgi:hypothetical protein